MQTATRPSFVPEVSRKVGYGFAVLMNAVLLVLVQNLLDWGWPRFLTAEFAELVPLISLSLGLSILMNVIYLLRDDQTLRQAGEVVVSLVSLYVTYRVFVVFPFDFSAYEFDWSIVARAVLAVAMVGAAIGAIANLAKLVTRSD